MTPFATLFQYYVKLQPGLSIENWITQNKIDTTAIDIRRLISFGIIKGFLKRIQVYPVWLDHPSFSEAEQAQQTAATALFKSRGRSTRTRHEVAPAQKTSSLAAKLAPAPKERDITPKPGAKHAESGRTTIADHITRRGYPASLPTLLDGEHSADEVGSCQSTSEWILADVML